MKYKGWIPVASGFISFTNIKGQVIAGRCHEAPTIIGSLDSCDSTPCTITSERTLIDRPFGPLRSALGSYDEQYSFECRVAKTKRDNVELLVGTVIAHPRIEANSAELIKKGKELKPGVYKSCLGWVISFELSRKGCITLDWGEVAPGQIAEIVDVPEGVEENQAEMLLTFEIFSFLKDLIHNHKFHSVDDDSIVVPIKVESDDDENWRDETARGIHRAIICSLRNNPSRLELTNALGKICYLRTFLSIGKTPFCEALLESLGNLERSIEVKLQGRVLSTSAWDVVRGTWITILLACVATAMTLVQLFQIPCIEGLSHNGNCTASFALPPSAVWFTNALLSNWTTFFVGIFAVLCGIGYLANRRSILELYSQRTGSERWDWHVMRFFYGLALTSGKYIALFWLTMLTGAMWFLMGYMIYSLIR